MRFSIKEGRVCALNNVFILSRKENLSMAWGKPQQME
jgi:hypothetical protein